MPKFKSKNQIYRIILLTFLFLSFIFIVRQVYAQPAPTAAPTATTPATTPVAAVTTPADTTLTIPQITGVHLVDWITNQGTFYTIWKAMIGLVDILVIIGFIVFALANVFHIKYDEYQAKKAIPGLIVGVILANLSYSICIFFIGAVQYLTNIFAGDPTQFWASFGQLYGWVWTLASTVSIAGLGLAAVGTGPGVIIAALFIFLIPILIMFAIGFIIWIRAFGIIALIGFAPLAFFLQAFPIQIPFLSDLAKKWWDYFFKLLFVAPIMFFLFWLAFMINGTAANNGSPVANQPSTTITDPIAATTDWCTRKKASMSDSNWKIGPCLGNLASPNDQIAVDVITGNTTTDAANKCTNTTKHITIDLNCSNPKKVGF